MRAIFTVYLVLIVMGLTYLTIVGFTQQWQSEFLAVGSMAVLAIYLRQRGSPESKPVGCPHYTTAAEG